MKIETIYKNVRELIVSVEDLLIRAILEKAFYHADYTNPKWLEGALLRMANICRVNKLKTEAFRLMRLYNRLTNEHRKFSE